MWKIFPLLIFFSKMFLRFWFLFGSKVVPSACFVHCEKRTHCTLRKYLSLILRSRIPRFFSGSSDRMDETKTPEVCARKTWIAWLRVDSRGLCLLWWKLRGVFFFLLSGCGKWILRWILRNNLSMKHTPTRIHIRTHTRAHTHTHVHKAHTHTHTTHTHTYTRENTHTHTHTRSFFVQFSRQRRKNPARHQHLLANSPTPAPRNQSPWISHSHLSRLHSSLPPLRKEHSRRSLVSPQPFSFRHFLIHKFRGAAQASLHTVVLPRPTLFSPVDCTPSSPLSYTLTSGSRIFECSSPSPTQSPQHSYSHTSFHTSELQSIESSTELYWRDYSLPFHSTQRTEHSLRSLISPQSFSFGQYQIQQSQRPLHDFRFRHQVRPVLRCLLWFVKLFFRFSPVCVVMIVVDVFSYFTVKNAVGEEFNHSWQCEVCTSFWIIYVVDLLAVVLGVNGR